MTARKPAQLVPTLAPLAARAAGPRLLTGSEDVRPAVQPKLAESLPPARALRRSVRELLEALDAEIRRNATATSGPPTTQPPLDVEELVNAWRRTREEQGSA